MEGVWTGLLTLRYFSPFLGLLGLEFCVSRPKRSLVLPCWGMCGPGRRANLLLLEFQLPPSQQDCPSALPSTSTSLGFVEKRREGKLNLVRAHWAAMVMDVSPSFLSHSSSGFILNQSHSGFRVSREDPSGDSSSRGLRKRLYWQLLLLCCLKIWKH